MLPAAHRLTDPAAFSDTVRSGVRAGSRALVLHLRVDARAVDGPTPAQVGLVVSKAIGGAVVRTRVKRRLRHELRALLPMLPMGSVLVVRALPPAAVASSGELAEELRGALVRCLQRTPEKAGMTQ